MCLQTAQIYENRKLETVIEQKYKQHLAIKQSLRNWNRCQEARFPLISNLAPLKLKKARNKEKTFKTAPKMNKKIMT